MKNIDGNIDVGDKWKLMTIFRGLSLKIESVGYENEQKVFTDTFRLQHPSPTSM